MAGPEATRRPRHHATLAIGLLVTVAFAVRTGRRALAQEALLPWLLLLLALYAAGACLWWAAAALRHRRPDPWAYDPELDGPIAQVMEGRSYLRSPEAEPQRPGSRRHAALLLALAFLFLLAGAWLSSVAGRTLAAARGAEAPVLSAFALYLAAALFLLAGPWLAWAGLRGVR